MTLRQVLGIGLVVAVGVGAHAAETPKTGVDWPQFRGIRARESPKASRLRRPGTFRADEESGGRPQIAGLGLASPIVWGDLICLSTSISGQKDAGLRVCCTATSGP